MKNYLGLILFSIFLTYNADAQFDKLLQKGKDLIGKESSDNTAAGLKEALNEGVNKAVKTLSVKDGYLLSPYKILVPEEAQVVISKVKKIPGFQNVEEKLVNQMNEAAEIAAKKATPIFIDAIKQMTIKDALSILMGEQDAATVYLRRTTNDNLYNAFLPVIQNSLEEVNALTYWNSVVTAYNKIPFAKKLNPELDDHVNQMALNGIYSLIEEKEKGIRTDSSQRTSELLRDVFGKQDK